MLWPLCSGVREAVVENVLLHAAGPGAVLAQGRARLPEEPVVGQCAQRHQDTSRAGHQGERLYEEAARVPAADCGPVRVFIPDERLEGAGQLDRDHQLRVRCLFRTSSGRRCGQPKAVPAAPVAHFQDQIASGGLHFTKELKGQSNWLVSFNFAEGATGNTRGQNWATSAGVR